MTDEREVALVITRNLPPLVGGMERLVWHIVDELRTDYRVHVIGPYGCSTHLPDGVTATEIPLRPMPLFLLRAKLAAVRQALRLRPTLVFAGSGLTVPFAWLAARLTGARCFAYLHGLDIEVRQPLYQVAWIPFFRHCDRVLVNSRFTKKLAEQAHIPSQRIFILNPGVALPTQQHQLAIQRRNDFRARHKLDDAPLMLYVGRITARKGLTTFIRDILPSIASQIPNAHLLVIGDEPTQALRHRSGERQRARQHLSANGLEERVMFLSRIDDDQLQAAYFAADVLVFPIQDIPHDHEGFGMVALEAAAHGLPTVAFAVGGVTDAIKENISGDLVPAGDTAAFTHKVITRLAASPTTKDAFSNTAKSFAASLAWPAFGQRLTHLCRPREAGTP